MTIVQLRAKAQSYDWGTIGSQSKVALYASATPPFNLGDSTPYAELWMGTHPSGPSTVLTSESPLKDYISDHPELLGDAVQDRFGNDLPFLFKVLAIGKALSIQAHPDKELAARLHRDHPDIYKDSNHKPEMAIAITPFRGFCGFLPPATIAKYLSVVPELNSIVSSGVSSSFQSLIREAPAHALTSSDDSIKKGIKTVFGALMKAPTEAVKLAVESIKSRYLKGSFDPMEQSNKELFLTLDDQFPGDVGILCVFLLNVVALEPGQAVFLRANEPHAYISGDIIETMATSDNVVRAGLTPKLRDVDTLLSMLTYTYEPAEKQILAPRAFGESKSTTLYNPPIDEFSVLVTHLSHGEEEQHRSIAGPSIIIITEGDGMLSDEDGDEFALKAGLVFFAGAGTPLKMKATSSDRLVVFRAYVEVDT